MRLKTYIQKNNLDPERTLDFIVGYGGELLPQIVGFQGYFGELTDTGILFTNEKLNIEKKEILYSSFQKAEFGMKGGQLWLQCVIDGLDFVFCLPRSRYKSAGGQFLLDKLEAQLGESLREDPDYKKYMGPFFVFWGIVKA